MYFNEDLQGIAWIDVESTGLSPYLTGDKLLQVACYVTDTDLNILEPQGFEAFVHYTPEETRELYDNTSAYVQNMHNSTGLWEKLSTEGIPLSSIDAQLKEYISSFYPDKKTVWFGGNSIVLDRNFVTAFLPETDAFLHYRNVDVTSVAGLALSWYGFSFEKKRSHNAKEDIMESIEELRALRKVVFKQ